MNEDLAYDAAAGLWYRPAAADRWVIAETGYRRVLERIRPSDIVLDLGAHIGSFTLRAARAGAQRVIAVEPDPANLQVLQKNVEQRDECDIINAAAVDSRHMGPLATLWKSPREGGDAYSTVARQKRGYTAVHVATADVHDLVTQTRASVVKIDVEGLEYDLLDRLDDRLKKIEMLAVEFELAPRYAGCAERAHGIITDAGLTTDQRPPHQINGRSTVRCYWREDRR